MTPGQRYHYAELLRRARDERTLVLAALGQGDRPERRATGARMIELQRSELSDIAVALEHLGLAPSRYGRCQICDEDIEPSQLDIEPWTRRCALHAFGPRGH